MYRLFHPQMNSTSITPNRECHPKPLLGLISCCLIFKSSHCNSFEYWPPSTKGLHMSCRDLTTWQGIRIVVPVFATKRHAPLNEEGVHVIITVLFKKWDQYLEKMSIHYFETDMSSFWWNSHHWLHWKLSKWQLPVQPVMKISSKWQHSHFSVITVSLKQRKGIKTDSLTNGFSAQKANKTSEIDKTSMPLP